MLITRYTGKYDSGRPVCVRIAPWSSKILEAVFLDSDHIDCTDCKVIYCYNASLYLEGWPAMPKKLSKRRHASILGLPLTDPADLDEDGMPSIYAAWYEIMPDGNQRTETYKYTHPVNAMHDKRVLKAINDFKKGLIEL